MQWRFTFQFQSLERLWGELTTNSRLIYALPNHFFDLISKMENDCEHLRRKKIPIEPKNVWNKLHQLCRQDSTITNETVRIACFDLFWWVAKRLVCILAQFLLNADWDPPEWSWSPHESNVYVITFRLVQSIKPFRIGTLLFSPQQYTPPKYVAPLQCLSTNLHV